MDLWAGFVWIPRVVRSYAEDWCFYSMLRLAMAPVFGPVPARVLRGAHCRATSSFLVDGFVRDHLIFYLWSSD